MIKITNDKNEFVVSQGAFETQFKNLGYRIVNENKPKISESKNNSVDNIDKKEEKNSFIKREQKEIVEEGTTEKIQRNRK